MRTLVGRSLIQVCFGTGVRLDFDGALFPEVTIEGFLEVTSQDGETWVGEPLSVDAAARLLPMLLVRVSAVAVNEEGSLAVELAGRSRIEVPVSQDFEAWQWRQDDGSLVVCKPGGDLSIWGPDPR
jgi:Family of unknown function (DUF6188)